MTRTQPLVYAAPESAEFWIDEGCFIVEHWNHPDDPALSIARARVPVGVRTRRHRLIGIVERYVILAGSGRLDVAGLAPQDVTVGDVVYIPADTMQCIENTGAVDLVFLALCTPRFRPELYQDLE